MVSNKKRRVQYDHIQVRKEAFAVFKSCMKLGETQTDTIMRLCKNAKNRKCPDATPGIIET